MFSPFSCVCQKMCKRLQNCFLPMKIVHSPHLLIKIHNSLACQIIWNKKVIKLASYCVHWVLDEFWPGLTGLEPDLASKVLTHRNPKRKIQIVFRRWKLIKLFCENRFCRNGFLLKDMPTCRTESVEKERETRQFKTRFQDNRKEIKRYM